MTADERGYHTRQILSDREHVPSVSRYDATRLGAILSRERWEGFYQMRVLSLWKESHDEGLNGIELPTSNSGAFLIPTDP